MVTVHPSNGLLEVPDVPLLGRSLKTRMSLKSVARTILARRCQAGLDAVESVLVSTSRGVVLIAAAA